MKKKREGFITRRIKEKCKKEVIKYSAISLGAGVLIGLLLKK